MRFSWLKLHDNAMDPIWALIIPTYILFAPLVGLFFPIRFRSIDESFDQSTSIILSWLLPIVFIVRGYKHPLSDNEGDPDYRKTALMIGLIVTIPYYLAKTPTYIPVSRLIRLSC